MSYFAFWKKLSHPGTATISKILGIFCLLGPLLLIQTQINSQAAVVAGAQLTTQERWVLGQVTHGEEADLRKQFGLDHQKCRISGAFFIKLLTGGFKNSPVSFQGIRITNAIIDGPIKVEYAEIDYSLCLSHCIIKDKISFQKSHFKKDLSFHGSHFLDNANFKALKVDGDISCEKTIFERESLWRDVKINEHFHGEKAEFRSREGSADFYAMTVGANAYFISAKFHGPANFGLAQIGREFYANNAEFLHEQAKAYFNSLKVNQNAIFKGARFHGPVDFVVAQIGFQFSGSGMEFLNPKESADFRGIKIGNTFFLGKAKFLGPVHLEFAEIGGNFRAPGIEFTNKDQGVSLYKSKVALQASFIGAIINCNIDMSHGNFFDLEINGKSEDCKAGLGENIHIPKLNLKGTTVQHELIICNARIAELDASQLIIKGPAIFKNIDIASMADFRHSSFQTMDFEDIKWPAKDKNTNTRKVYISNLTYSGISINKPGNVDYQKKDFEAIMDFLQASPFNTQSYVQMETFFTGIGRDSWAKEAFISMHDRELKEKMSWWDPRRWLKWFFWGHLAGYGRAPFRVFFVSLGLIIFGAFIFNPEYLTTKKIFSRGKTFESIIMRLFLSLDRFLPIELGLAKAWDANGRRFFIWFYFYLQQILGWILIPIALASIYSQLK